MFMVIPLLITKLDWTHQSKLKTLYGKTYHTCVFKLKLISYFQIPNEDWTAQDYLDAGYEYVPKASDIQIHGSKKIYKNGRLHYYEETYHNWYLPDTFPPVLVLQQVGSYTWKPKTQAQKLQWLKDNPHCDFSEYDGSLEEFILTHESHEAYSSVLPTN